MRKPAERRQGARGRAGARGLDHGATAGDRARPDGFEHRLAGGAARDRSEGDLAGCARRPGWRLAGGADGPVRRRDPCDLRRSGRQLREHRVGVAAADRVGERSDRAAVAVDAVQHDDPVADPHPRRGRRRVHLAAGDARELCACRLAHRRAGGRGTHDVAQHRARLDRRELGGVADQHEPRVGAHGVEQPGHHRDRHHRGLVDDHDVVGEPAAAVVAEAAVAARPPAEQAVERDRLQRQQLCTHRRAHIERQRLLVHRLGQPGRRAAGGGRERDEGCRRAGRQCLFGEQSDDPSDRRGLAGAGPAGDDREAPQHRGGRSQALALALLPGEQPCEALGEHAEVDVAARAGVAARSRVARLAAGARPAGGARLAARAAVASGPAPAARDQVGGDQPLLAPVAIEVEPGAEEAPRAGRPRRRRRRTPRARWPPRARAMRRRRATAARTGRPAPRPRPPRCRGCARGRRRRARRAARAPRAPTRAAPTRRARHRARPACARRARRRR